jgi:integrase
MDARSRRRFDSKVVRAHDHDRWTGAVRADGVGMVKVDGRPVAAPRVAWELAHGPLADDVRVERCLDEPACVRVEHLAITRTARASRRPKERERSAAGSMREVSQGRWELSVTSGRFSDGSVRRLYKTVEAPSRREASRALATFVSEVQSSALPAERQDLHITVDAAIEQFLAEHLLTEKGRHPKTVDAYRQLHRRWFADAIGQLPVRKIDEATMDRAFGRMATAGLSHSRMNQAKALYRPFFRWAKTRRLIERNPMADFQLPTSRKASRERTAPEVHELAYLLERAAEITPDILPILVLGAVTGMRRGELLGLRRSRLRPHAGRIVVDAAIDEGRRVKTTKTRRDRTFHIDLVTMTMLLDHCEAMDERARALGTIVGEDAFVFSNAPDCSLPIPPDQVTKRVAVLKDHLGISDKSRATVELEDRALELYRGERAARPKGTTGPAPKGALSYAAIGRLLGRTDRWVAGAIRSAERRETARNAGVPYFDGSILALRKFTSTELLDSGFNVSMVAQRQGHGPAVLIKHYAKARDSADRKAAEHLGSVVHRAAAGHTRRAG